MYENANTPASANAIPALPTTSVIATPAIVERDAQCRARQRVDQNLRAGSALRRVC